jgi:methyltransferase (TIGR00027 family)
MSSDTSRKVALASSACWIAAIRAYESEHANRLFNDPWAALLAGQARQDWSNHLLVQGDKAGMAIVIRTRFFDNFLLRAVGEHQIRQIVVLAAGMDTRAFRLVWPEGTKLFELDQPELLAQKERLLSSARASSTCWHQTLGIDLRDPWADALCQAGFDPLQPSVWLLEGFLHYLPVNSILYLIDTITSLSASESQLGFNVINSEMLISSNARILEKKGFLWISAMDEPEVVLAERGWSATVIQTGEKGANFGRWSYPITPRSVPGIPRRFLVTATRMPDK